MNRERLFKHLEDHYIPKREMISRIPLGVQPDEFWQDVQNRRRARSISLQLHSPRGIPYWYVVTKKMIAASERIVDEMMANETEFDPYRDTPSASSLEESFFTSYVEGSQITMQDAMAFLQGDREPQEPEEQMILNNRNALSFAGANLFRPVDEDYIKTLAYILTENIDGGGQEYRMSDYLEIPSMVGLPYELPTALALPDRVQEICMLLHDPGIHPLIKSGLAQAWVLVTRPFPEGNERLGRLLSQVILFRAGYVFFSEVSLSNLIARSSFAYFNSIANILLPENGADLTYFLEYYMALLDRAVAERHLRLTQWTEEEQIAEREMAQQPLARAPEQLQVDTAIYENPPFEPDDPGESIPAEGSDETTIDLSIVKKKILLLTEGPSERLAACASILLNYIDQGKTVFSVLDISRDMNIDTDTAGNVITQLKTKRIVKSLRREERIMLYAFCDEELPTSEVRNKRTFRKALTHMSQKTHAIIGRSAGVLLKYLDKGQHTISGIELQNELGISSEQTHRLCYQLKEKRFLVLINYEDDHPHYALAFSENPAIYAVSDQPKKQKQEPEKEYSAAFMERLQELSNSIRSSKDLRVAAMLKECLSKGTVTFQDYRDAGYANSWHKDMLLASQMGLVEKVSHGCYRIMRDVKPGPAMLSSAQKEIASTMYQNFGEETFSSEMVVATLDYAHSHVSAVLHQFTMMRILNCSNDSNNKYFYQFRVNPRENPECFTDVA